MSNPRQSSRLLIHEAPLQVLPSLAAAIGLNEAIVLQQIHFLLGLSDASIAEGQRWVTRSMEAWVKEFSWWSIRTVKQVFANLKRRKLIITGKFNQNKWDHTLWYRVDYDALEAITPIDNGCTVDSAKSVQSDSAEIAPSESTEIAPSSLLDKRNKRDSIVANKSPRAKKVKEPAPPKEKKPRTPQRTDPLFDAIGKHIFSATTPAAVEAVNFRIGQIIYGDKRRTSTGLLDFETQRQGKSTTELDYNQLAKDVGVFWKNFQKNHPDLDLKDCVKVMEWWIKFRAAQDKQTQATDSGQAGYDENRGVWYRTVNGKREELDPAKGSWEAVA